MDNGDETPTASSEEKVPDHKTGSLETHETRQAPDATTADPLEIDDTQERISSSSWMFRKPLSVVHQQEVTEAQQASHHVLKRHLSVWDLIGIGVGGTVGSGIFVLTGQIAANFAGPCTFVSFAIAGVAACCSGVCYAELSGRIPAAGSTYVYSYVCLGEVAAVVAAACLTLEYGVSGAAVARSWGDKIIDISNSWLNISTAWMKPWGINVPASIVSLASTFLLLAGVQESKQVTNFFTAFKMLIVLFMTVGGLVLFQKANYAPPIAPFGASGILRGATSSFFGYLGYDEVCCVAGEAQHPARDMPRAVLGTLITVTICYVLAAFALTGMVHYTEVSPTSGFPAAFSTRNVEWAAHVTALGEVVTLPVVVIISLMAQPRLTLSMAHDGLLPSIFAHVDNDGNLQGGTLVSGILMTFIATFVPFTYLDDLISAGILLAFSMTNSCLVLLRCESPSHRPNLLDFCLVLYNALCFLTALLWSHSWSYLPLQTVWACLSTITTFSCLVYMARHCPSNWSFGGSVLDWSWHQHPIPGQEQIDDSLYFRTPFVPYLPCLGMAINWYLIAQLDALGILLLCVYVGLTIAIYAFGCARHSVGHARSWGHRRHYEIVDGLMEEEEGEPRLDLAPLGNIHNSSRSIS